MTSKPAMKYLKIMVDPQLNFKQDTDNICEYSSTKDNVKFNGATIYF